MELMTVTYINEENLILHLYQSLCIIHIKTK